MVRGSLKNLVSKSFSFAGKWQQQQLRRFNIQEYQGAELMSKYGINVPRGVAEVQKDIKDAFPGHDEVAVKGQVLAGGRGLGTFINGLKGGVHIAKVNQVANLDGFVAGAPLISQPRFENPSFARFFSTNLPNKSNYEIKLGKGENDDQKNVIRPLSPHLPVYRPQSNSLSSIFNRVSAIYLTCFTLGFYLVYIKAGPVCLTYPSFYKALFYSSKLSMLACDIAALAAVYHVYHGIRDLLR